MTDNDEFTQIMQAGGIFDARVMVWALTDEVADDLCAIDCAQCCEDLELGTLVYCWGEPMGTAGTLVAITTHCSDDCVSKYIQNWLDDRFSSDESRDLYVTYHAMNWRYEEE